MNKSGSEINQMSIFLLLRSIFLFSQVIYYLHNLTVFCTRHVYLSDEKMEMNFSLIYEENLED